MPAVTRPLVDPNTQEPEGQYAILAHELARKLLNGSGTQHARVRALQANLQNLSTENYKVGLEQGQRLERVALKEALAKVHSALAPLHQGMVRETTQSLDEVKEGIGGALDVLAVIIASCEEAVQVEEAIKQAEVAPPPQEEPIPAPPQGMFAYKAAIGPGGGLEISPKPTSVFSLDNCVVWMGDRWVAWTNVTASLPCWVGSRIKPKG